MKRDKVEEKVVWKWAKIYVIYVNYNGKKRGVEGIWEKNEKEKGKDGRA